MDPPHQQRNVYAQPRVTFSIIPRRVLAARRARATERERERARDTHTHTERDGRPLTLLANAAAHAVRERQGGEGDANDPSAFAFPLA